MLEKQPVKVPGARDWEAEFGFSPAVKLGNMIYLTGHVGCDKNGVCVSDALEPQVIKVFENLQATLTAAGSDLSKMLQMTCFIVDILRNGPPFWALISPSLTWLLKPPFRFGGYSFRLNAGGRPA